MKRIVIAALVLGLSSTVAIAQTPTPESTPTAAPNIAPAPSAPAMTPGPDKQTAKEVRRQCAAETKGKGLERDARKAAIDDCFAKARPDLAARQKCAREGKDKGLAHKELGAYVKQCLAAQ